MANAGEPQPGSGRWDPNCEWPPHPRRLLEPDAVFDSMVPTYLARINKTQMLRTAFANRAHIPGRVRGEISGLGRGYAYSTEFAHSVHAEFARSFREFSPSLGGRASGRREASASPLDHHLLLGL